MTYDTTQRASTASAGISFADRLAVVFIALKLGGVISLSWWLVLAPLCIDYVIGLIATAICLLWAVLT